MKNKLLAIIVGATLLLTACGGQPTQRSYSSVSAKASNDTVLWVNADGTDCDLGDYLEGDIDCTKKKKKTYYNAPSHTVVSKFKSKTSNVKSTVKQKLNTVKKSVTPKVNIVKKKVDATKKATSTYKKRVKSTSSWGKSSFSKSSSSKSSYRSSSSSRKRK